MNILFVCKNNRFRSQVAEAFFNQLNTNSSLKATSAGIFKGLPISPSVFTVANEFGIKLDGQPKTISVELIRDQDLIIIVADNVPKSLFTEDIKFKRKTIVWEIPDTAENNIEDIKQIVELIKKKVKELIKK